MLPKLDHRRAYASKCWIQLRRSLAIKQGYKSTSGQIMGHAGGQELIQITYSKRTAPAHGCK